MQYVSKRGMLGRIMRLRKYRAVCKSLMGYYGRKSEEKEQSDLTFDAIVQLISEQDFVYFLISSNKWRKREGMDMYAVKLAAYTLLVEECVSEGYIHREMRHTRTLDNRGQEEIGNESVIKLTPKGAKLTELPDFLRAALSEYGLVLTFILGLLSSEVLRRGFALGMRVLRHAFPWLP